MSVPLAVTVNVPEFNVDDPAGDGAPMSCASQGAGTAACAAAVTTTHITVARTSERTE